MKRALPPVQELLAYSAAALAKAIRERSVSSAEVVGAYLARIDQVNPSINALVQTNPRALEEAHAADSRLEGGASVGPLHGVPFTAKDVLAVEGLVAAVGIPERRHVVPKRDATVVARMRNAGAVLLGKTNTPPFGGGGETDNPVYGRTLNPFDLERTPGGSSGGEAALLAAGGSPLGLGSDSGGSLRLPAHFCGVATIKPTHGRVPISGFFPPTGAMADPRSTIGPMARSVEDLVLALPLLCGPDGRDPSVPPVPAPTLAGVDLRGLRFAFHTHFGETRPSDETDECVRQVARLLNEAGAVGSELDPPELEESFRITIEYWSRSGRTGAEVDQALRDWDKYRRGMMGFMESVDLVVSPVCAHPAPGHGTVGAETFKYTVPYSLTGAPVAVVRVGTSREGLPIGVQLAAAPWQDGLALAAAAAVEAALGPFPAPGLEGEASVG